MSRKSERTTEPETLETKPFSSRLSAWIALLLSVAAAGYALWIVPDWNAVGALSFDEENYIATAERLLTEHVFSFWGDGPDAYVSPGYPMFLTVLFAVFGVGARGVCAVRIIQCLMTGATVFLTYRLGRTLTGRDGAGLIAAALVFLNGGF
jgi:4-amino-4-deoxy-L-arabinose transferase-like glycosyltransferase